MPGGAGGAAADAEVGPPDPASGGQRAHDHSGRLVDRHGHAQALTDPGADEGGVDAYYLSRTVCQCAARVARVEGGVGLDDIPEQPVTGASRRQQATAEGAHDPGAHRALEAERVTYGHDQLTDPEPARVTEPGGLVAVPGRPHDRQVAQTVGADYFERCLVARGKSGRPAARALHDVRGREQQPVCRDQHGRACAGRAVHLVFDPERRHRRQELFGYPRHRARVTIEQGFVDVVRRRPEGHVLRRAHARDRWRVLGWAGPGRSAEPGGSAGPSGAPLGLGAGNVPAGTITRSLVVARPSRRN